MLSRAMQSAKAPDSISVTDYGSTIDVKDLHPRKARWLILRRELDKVTVAKEEHSENVNQSIEITESGIVNSVRAVHPQNAFWSILVTESGILTEVSEEQLLNA